MAEPHLADMRDYRGFLKFHESHLIAELLRTGTTNVSRYVQGAFFSVLSLNATHGTIQVPVVGTRASVAAPTGALLPSLGAESMLLSAVYFPGNASGEEEPLAVMGVSAFSEEGRALEVEGLSQCIVLSFPFGRRGAGERQPSCGYFNEAAGAWEELRGELLAEELRCCTRHLSLFGVLLRGFLAALTCSQLGLFRLESMRRLLAGEWYASDMALLFWGLSAAMALLQAGAAWSDRRRKGAWDDSCFLVPRREGPGGDEEAGAEMVPGAARGLANAAREAALLGQDQGKGVCMDVVTELMSRGFKSCSRVRSLLEEVKSAVAVDGPGGDVSESRVRRMAHAMVDAMAMKLTSAQVGWSLRVSSDMVLMALTDADFGELVLKRAPSEAAGATAQLAMWRDFHAEALEHMDRAWKGLGPRSLPLAALQLFFASCPLTSLFVADCAMCSKLRALLLIAETAGSTMVACIFFVASGSARSALDDEECSEPKDLWEELANITAVATFSLIMGTLPVSLIASLHSRSFISVEYKGCPEWDRQLRLWRVKDRIFVALSLLFIAFCIFTVLLFLATVAGDDLLEWGVTGAITFAEDMVLIPVAGACLTPALAMGLFLAVACATGRECRDLLAARKRQLELAEGNWAASESSAGHEAGLHFQGLRTCEI